VKITDAASPHTSGLWTVPGKVAHVAHLLRVPSGACPFSRNPVLGLARLTYASAGLTLEVVALHRYMQEIVRPAVDHPRSVEGLAARIAADASAAVGVPVAVELTLLVRPWQVLRVRA
jgi:hypothetical protein